MSRHVKSQPFTGSTTTRCNNPYFLWHRSFSDVYREVPEQTPRRGWNGTTRIDHRHAIHTFVAAVS